MPVIINIVEFCKKTARLRWLRPRVDGFAGCLIWVVIGLFISSLPCDAIARPAQAPTSGVQQGDAAAPGTISGTIVDKTGTAVAGARVILTPEGQSPRQEQISGEDGQFAFTKVAPGPFQLTVTAVEFATQASTGVLRAGETHVVPAIMLTVATAVTEVRVELSPAELATEQLKDEEKQRVLGVIPNFYVTYVPNAAPLSSKQKFQLALKATIDPVTLGFTAADAGVQQATNHFSGYGQGAEGYGKRFGAAYADLVTGLFIGGAILPSVLKQDPRYFYKGTGSAKSRAMYALANTFICKGDNGRWQPNYSEVGGSLASAGISNLYYPASDRGAGLTFENAAISLALNAATNLLQEFVIRKLTPKLPAFTPVNQSPSTP